MEHYNSILLEICRVIFFPWNLTVFSPSDLAPRFVHQSARTMKPPDCHDMCKYFDLRACPQPFIFLSFFSLSSLSLPSLSRSFLFSSCSLRRPARERACVLAGDISFVVSFSLFSLANLDGVICSAL